MLYYIIVHSDFSDQKSWYKNSQNLLRFTLSIWYDAFSGFWIQQHFNWCSKYSCYYSGKYKLDICSIIQLISINIVPKQPISTILIISFLGNLPRIGNFEFIFCLVCWQPPTCVSKHKDLKKLRPFLQNSIFWYDESYEYEFFTYFAGFSFYGYWNFYLKTL